MKKEIEIGEKIIKMNLDGFSKILGFINEPNKR